jgi:hypothetical protein
MVTKDRLAPRHQENYLPDLPDQLAAYDKAMASFLCTMQFDYAAREDETSIRPLRVVKASPERAFGDLRERFADTDTPYTVFEGNQEQTALPIASFMRTDLLVDPTRFNPNFERKVDFLSNEKAEIYQHKWPLPYNFTYQVDFWTRYESTLDAMRVWFALAFSDGGTYRLLSVDFSDISRFYGTKRVFTRFDGINDTSDLEPGTEPRVERATATLEIQGWIFFPILVAKTVLSSKVDILIVPDDVDIDSDEANDDANIVDTVTLGTIT